MFFQLEIGDQNGHPQGVILVNPLKKKRSKEILSAESETQD
jgi:hypothetical protein